MTMILAPGFGRAEDSTFDARLSTVPIDFSTQSLVTGHGEVTATLEANVLTITGTFEGLQRPATFAKLYMAPHMGLRGEAIFDVPVTEAVRGSLDATVSLSPEQLEALHEHRLYIQIHSKSAPEGNLWGFLIKR
jgi:hypothetical protein